MSSYESRRLTPAERYPWLRFLLIPFVLPIALAVFAAVLPLFGILLVVGVASNYIVERRFRSLLRRKGRFLPWQTALERMNANPGTLIVEQPAPGWGYTRAWWTADDVLFNSPYPMPTKDEYHQAASQQQSPPWDLWCWNEYLSPETGHAYLIRIWNGDSVEFRLRMLFRQLRVVTTWTAFVHRPALPREDKSKSN